jgi:agmatine/peptidylarginine deiminase
MDGILLAWEGPSSWTDILKQMAVQITTVGAANVYVAVDDAAEQALVRSALATAGVDLTRVRFVVTPTDTIWIRDYGPRYVYEGRCRAIVDHTYNRPRPLDDVLPAAFGRFKRHAFYEHQLVHGGGNFHLDALGRAHTTRLVNHENPTLTEGQIHDIWRDYQNVDTRFYAPFPVSVDLTQHIDMWLQVIGDRAVVISDWPFDQSSPQDQICDQAATALGNLGITVHRVPARSLAGTHYTYTNVVMCNQLVLVPRYANPAMAAHDTEAANAWRAALPGRTIVQIDCEAIVPYAGVMHCIAMHVPAHLGGLEPTAYLQTPDGGETLLPNTQVDVRWITDDDESVASVDLLLSTNAGASFTVTIAAAIPDTGLFRWTVPDLLAPQARLRVVARDAQGRTGQDESDRDFRIAGTQCPAVTGSYGSGKAGTRGVPVLSAPTPPRIPSRFALDLANALPSSPALLLLGFRPASFPFDEGTVLVDFQTWLPFATSAAGTFTLPLSVPPEPALCGVNLFWQVWIPNDPGASGSGWASSSGLHCGLGS